VATGVQRLGRYSPFVRLGYAEGGSDGPTPVEHMVNIGVVVDDIFGQANDRIGVGFTWSDPADGSLSSQEMIDSYYRVQMTPEIAISPSFQVIFNPVRNSDEDTIYIWGIRTRIEIEQFGLKNKQVAIAEYGDVDESV
jgi:porin